MSKQTFLPLVVAGLALVGAAVAGRFWPAAGGTALAHPGHGDATPTADEAFMGVADPAAPYDLRFIDEMTMHHQGAIVSAEMMIGDSERPELRDLARRIQEGQRRQIERMRAWREAWYPDAPAPAMDMGPMADMMEMMGGGMMDGMMGGEGADRMFLRMMIPHHQLAVDMAEDALDRAEHEELKGFAREIIREQSAEIAEMEGYLRDWYGDASTRDDAEGMRDMMRTMMGASSTPASTVASTPAPAAPRP